MADLSPEVAAQVVSAVSEYGRWDDVLVLLDTGAKKAALALVKSQIEKDTAAMANGECVSLLGKWLPSVNASSKESVRKAKILMNALEMKAADYRKLCSALRKQIKILEDFLRRRDYSFDYSEQPSQAMLKYKKAFLRNDGERYRSFLKKVIETADCAEKEKLNTKTLFPYQIVSAFDGGRANVSAEQALPLEASWQSLERGSFKSRTIVVRDGSGSMYGTNEASPINIATSLALLFAEQLSGAFKNSFITFSQNPALVQIPETADTLQKKMAFISRFDDYTNTDIAKVYQLILDTATNGEVPKDEMIERVLIISDMEFDECAPNESTFDVYKKRFADAGYELPELVFWNVVARGIHLPVTQNEKGVKLVSGASAQIFGDVVSGTLKNVTPYEFMLQMLAPYSEFNSIVA